MSGCPPKQKRSTVEAILNCLSLCSNTGVGQDKNFGQVDCKKCYYTCKEGNNIEVRCKQCQTESQQKAVAKCSDICSKCKRRKLACSTGKCSKNKSGKESDEKGILCKKCKEICEDGKRKLVCKQCKQPIKSEQEDKNVETENPPPQYKEMNPKMLNKLDCKICGFEAQIDGTKDFVCYPCIDKAKKKLCATAKECKSSGEKKTITQDLYPCEQCGVKVTKERCHNVLRLICDRCADGKGGPTSGGPTSGGPTLEGNLGVSNITPYSVDLSWAKPKQEPEKYLIQVQENAPNGVWKTEQTLPGDLDPTRTTVSGLVPGVPYAFRVIAVDKNNQESPPITSDVVTTPLGEPTSGGPTLGGNLDVSNITPYSVDLSWDKPEQEPEKYLIQVQENAPNGDWKTEQTLPGDLDPTRTTVSGLVPGVPYAFRVIAVDKNNQESPPITSDVVTTPLGEPTSGGPTLGGNLDVSNITPYSVDLSWDKPEREPEKYLIQVQENAPNGDWKTEQTLPGDLDPTRTTVSGLVPGVPYAFRVIAVDKNNQESPPITSDVVTTPLGGPTLGGNLDVSNITPYSVDLSWAKPEKEPEKYLIQVQDNAPNGDWKTEQTLPGDLDPTRTTVSGLVPGVPYAFRVIAVDKNNQESPPITSDVVTTPLDEEKLRVSDITPHSAALSWDKPEEEPEKYNVEQQENNESWTPVKTLPGNVDPNKVPVTDLKENTPYKFRVTPERGGVLGTPLVSKQITTPSGADEEKLRVSDITPHSAALSWDKPEEEPEKYNVEQQENNESWTPVKTLPGNVDPNKVPVTDLKENTPYKFRVTPERGGVLGTPLVSKQITTPSGAEGGPNTPEGPLRVSDITPVSAVLNWKHSPDGERPQSYEIEKQLYPDGPWQTVDTVPYDAEGAPKAVVNDLEPDTLYMFRVRGKNENGNSPPLQTVDPIRTLPLQDPEGGAPNKPEPPIVVTDVNPKGLTLNWNEPKKGPKTKAYFIDKQSLPDGPWVPVTEVPGNQTKYVFEDLTEGNYKFRVAAGNKVGKSPPLESDEVHVPEQEPSELELYSSGLPRTWSQSVYEPETSGPRKRPTKKVRAKSRAKSRARSRPGSRGGRVQPRRGRPPSGGRRPPKSIRKPSKEPGE